MTKPILCIYHANCADGFGAAWVVHHWAQRPIRGGVEFFAGTYGNPPPGVAGRDVVIVDFSYKRTVLNEMARSARTVLLLDHHETAQKDLAGLPPPVSSGPTGPAPVDWGFVDVISGYDPESMRHCAEQCNGPPLYALFDMNRSGAGLAWDFFFPGAPRPALINHIEDRDLWRFKLPGTRDIQAAVYSYPYDFEVWDKLMALDPAKLADEGTAIERKHHKDIAELVKVMQRRMVIGGHSIPVANLPYTLTSDAGHLMAEGEPFAGCYWDTPAGRVFSLRSRDDGANVAEIAAGYGGGGHAHAAGFRMPIGWEGDAA